MNLISYPVTIQEILGSQIKPFLYLIMGMVVLGILKRIFNYKLIKKIKLIDLFPVFAWFTMVTLTIDGHGNSLLPLFILIWMLLAIIGIIYRLISVGEVIIKPFLIAFWRFGDLYWLFLYVIFFFIKLIR